jgi:hypothetical protein
VTQRCPRQHRFDPGQQLPFVRSREAAQQHRAGRERLRCRQRGHVEAVEEIGRHGLRLHRER